MFCFRSRPADETMNLTDYSVLLQLGFPPPFLSIVLDRSPRIYLPCRCITASPFPGLVGGHGRTRRWWHDLVSHLRGTTPSACSSDDTEEHQRINAATRCFPLHSPLPPIDAGPMRGGRPFFSLPTRRNIYARVVYSPPSRILLAWRHRWALAVK